MALEVLQAKILMAMYEHLQANHIAAIGTISSASAIAKALSYFHWDCRSTTHTISFDDEGQRAVCCLYVLERLIYVANDREDSRHAVFSVPRPCPIRALPHDHKQSINFLLGNDCYCDQDGLSPTGNAPYATHSQPPYLLKRVFQASILLDLAISESSLSSIIDESTRTQRRRTLQMLINSFGCSLLEDRDQGAQVNCSALAICVISTLIVHGKPGNKEGLTLDKSLMSAIRMVFDRLKIVPTFQYQFSKVISVWELHCFYLTARTCLRLRPLLGPHMEKAADQALGVTMKTLQEYSHQWKLAEEFLTRLRLFRPCLDQ